MKLLTEKEEQEYLKTSPDLKLLVDMYDWARILRDNGSSITVNQIRGKFGFGPREDERGDMPVSVPNEDRLEDKAVK